MLVEPKKIKKHELTWLLLLLLLPLLLLVLLLSPFRCVEVVAWPFVVIEVCTSYAHSLVVKKQNNVSRAKKNKKT
jgi:hypothetical protein